jgi:hypothetical protein
MAGRGDVDPESRVDSFSEVASGVGVMGDRLVAVAIVFDVALVLYTLLTIAQRACLRRSRRHRRYADWYTGAARGCRRLVEWNAARAGLATGVRARAFYRRMSEQLPRDAARHEIASRRHSLRARFWDFMA